MAIGELSADRGQTAFVEGASLRQASSGSLDKVLRERLSTYVDEAKLRYELSQSISPDTAAKLFAREDGCAKEIAAILSRYRVGGRLGLNLARTTYLLLPTFLIATIHAYEQLRWTRGRLRFLYSGLNFVKFDTANGYSYRVFNHLISIHQVAEYDLIANDWGLPSIYRKPFIEFFRITCSCFSWVPWKTIYSFAVILIDLVHHAAHMLNHTLLSGFVGEYNVSPWVQSYITVHWQSASHIGFTLDYRDLERELIGVTEVSYSLFVRSIEFLAEALVNQTGDRFDPTDEEALRSWLIDL